VRARLNSPELKFYKVKIWCNLRYILEMFKKQPFWSFVNLNCVKHSLIWD
jgi:hypothetical protein